jgi:DNA-binding transcriptional regulator YdaS (Cro superfamily)
MELKNYLKKNGIKTIELAKVIGCQQSHVSLIANGKRKPSPELALAIEQATNGQVTRMELLYPDSSEAA